MVRLRTGPTWILKRAQAPIMCLTCAGAAAFSWDQAATLSIRFPCPQILPFSPLSFL